MRDVGYSTAAGSTAQTRCGQVIGVPAHLYAAWCNSRTVAPAVVRWITCFASGSVVGDWTGTVLVDCLPGRRPGQSAVTAQTAVNRLRKPRPRVDNGISRRCLSTPVRSVLTPDDSDYRLFVPMSVATLSWVLAAAIGLHAGDQMRPADAASGPTTDTRSSALAVQLERSRQRPKPLQGGARLCGLRRLNVAL
jgi:hypothetical protein